MNNKTESIEDLVYTMLHSGQCYDYNLQDRIEAAFEIISRLVEERNNCPSKNNP